MTKLVQSLIESSSSGPFYTIPIGTDLVLEQETMRIYEAAAANMREQQRSLSREYRATLQQLDRYIHVQVTAELAAVDLLDPRRYQAIQTAVERWKPASKSELVSQRLKVRQSFLEMLPAARTKQQLEKPLSDYRSYLKTEIESGLASDHPVAYTTYSQDRMGTEIVKAQPQQKLVRAKDLDYFLKNEAQTLSVQNEGLQQAMGKYATVKIAHDTLHTAKPATDQLHDFQGMLPQVKLVVDKSRDSAGMTFLKVVATIFTLGVAALAGIWRVKGQKTTEKVEGILATLAMTPA